MPEIKVQHVVSFSSEDKRFPAENLLKPEGTSKWRSAGAGEKKLSAVLQFEKASIIHQIDIGNDGAAFIEVLVGRSSQKEEDYQVILVASSFMSPPDSRNGQNLNRVRIFNKDALSKAACEEKWDRVKVVCSQPFCKTSPYGLSFIKFHSPSDGSQPTAPQKQRTLGAFTVKDEPDKDSISAGSLFASRGKEKTELPPLTGAAAAREASRSVTSPATPVPPRVKQESNSSPSPSGSKTEHKPKPERKPSLDTPGKVKRKHSGDGEGRPPLKKQSTSLSSVSSSTSTPKPDSLKKTKSDPGKMSSSKEFGQLMSRVVFVMSGYQNPERAKIRDRAIEMGAQYKPDWGRGCTHLICAFVNTPKYDQVKGKGRIVDKDWIRDSYKSRKLMPWRRYRVGRAASPAGSSEDEDEEPSKKATEKNTPKQKEPSPKKASPTAGVFDDDTDVESGEDTDDEIRKVKAGAEQQKKVKAAHAGNSKEDPFDVSTDDEMENGDAEAGKDEDALELPELPDFFNNKHFFLYGKMAPSQQRTMLRYITAYNGNLLEYMSNEVTHVITESDWDDNFDDALSENPNIAFVRPTWIHTCHDKQKVVPHQKFVVVPQ